MFDLTQMSPEELRQFRQALNGAYLKSDEAERARIRARLRDVESELESRK